LQPVPTFRPSAHTADSKPSLASAAAETLASGLEDAVSVDVSGAAVRIEWEDSALTEVDLDALSFGR